MADLVLQLSRVAHERNGRRLLDGVGLSLRAGEAAVLVRKTVVKVPVA